MSRTVRSLTSVSGAIVVLLALGAAGAQAQATRTWVSGVGDDVNPCSRTAPCKTFAGAISKTADPGEIDALDPGGYGAVTITKSMTLDGTGNLASVLSSGVQGVIVNAPGKDVVLRNVQLSGAGVTLGTNGVNVIAAASVTLEHVSIEHYSNAAVTITAATPVRVLLDDVTIKDSTTGLLIPASAAGAADVQLQDVTMSGGTDGVVVQGSGASKLVLDRVSIPSPSGRGVRIAPTGGAAPKVLLRDTTITGANPAVQVDAGGYAGLLGSLLSYNALGLLPADGAVLEDLGGNTLTNNTTDGSFTKTPPPAATVTVTTPAPPPVTNTVTVTRVVCAVPDVRGLTLTAARRALTTGHCTAGKVTKRATKKRSQVGRVLSQSVKAGTQTGEGKAVALVVGRKA